METKKENYGTAQEASGNHTGSVGGKHHDSADPMTAVKSTAFTHVHHRPESNILTIRFNGGREQEYHNFPEDKYQEFIKSPSMGKYFSEQIRNNPEHNQGTGGQQEQVA